MIPIDTIIDYIETKLPGLYAPVQAIPMGKEIDGISLLIAPSGPSCYYFEGVSDCMLLNIRARSASNLKTLQAVSAIAHTLESAKKGDIKAEGICFTHCKIYTNPNFIYMDLNDSYVYGSMVKVYFERR